MIELENAEGIAMKKMTRMEYSKECRRVLNRHGVDLSYCQYTCTGYEVRLHGWLCKTDASDYTAYQIEEMLRDFHHTLQGFSVYGEMENWAFNSERIQFLGDKFGDKKGGGDDATQEVYTIDLDEFDFEAS